MNPVFLSPRGFGSPSLPVILTRSKGSGGVHVMPIPVKLSEIVDEISMSGDEISTYLNRVTGEMVTVTAEEARVAEDPED